MLSNLVFCRTKKILEKYFWKCMKNEKYFVHVVRTMGLALIHTFVSFCSQLFIQVTQVCNPGLRLISIPSHLWLQENSSISIFVNYSKAGHVFSLSFSNIITNCHKFSIGILKSLMLKDDIESLTKKALIKSLIYEDSINANIYYLISLLVK